MLAALTNFVVFSLILMAKLHFMNRFDIALDTTIAMGGCKITQIMTKRSQSGGFDLYFFNWNVRT